LIIDGMIPVLPLYQHDMNMKATDEEKHIC